MTLDELRREHENIARLLLVLEAHLSSVHSGDAFDAPLMLDTLTYLVDDVDRFHRDREDVAVDFDALTRHGVSLRDRLLRVVDDEPVDRADLVREGFAYCTDLRRTMSLEETSLASANAAAAPTPSREAAISAQERYRRAFEELTHRIGCDCSYGG